MAPGQKIDICIYIYTYLCIYIYTCIYIYICIFVFRLNGNILGAQKPKRREKSTLLNSLAQGKCRCLLCPDKNPPKRIPRTLPASVQNLSGPPQSQEHVNGRVGPRFIHKEGRYHLLVVLMPCCQGKRSMVHTWRSGLVLPMLAEKTSHHRALGPTRPKTKWLWDQKNFLRMPRPSDLERAATSKYLIKHCKRQRMRAT